MESQNTNSNSQSQKLNAEIRKTWGKLTDEEIGFYQGKRDKFFEAVQAKYSISKDEAEKTIKKLEAESTSGGSTSSTSGSTTSGKDSGTAAGPTAKAANDSTATVGPVAKAANA